MRWPKWLFFGGVVFFLGAAIFGGGLASTAKAEGIAFEDGVSAVEASAPVYSDPSTENLSKFRLSLLKAAEQEFKSGGLSRGDLWRLRLTSLNPIALKKMHRCCAEQAMADGKIKSYAAIDWDALLALIKELIPIILELIKLLSYAEPPVMQSEPFRLVFYDCPRSIGRSSLIGCSMSLAA